jgi:hypothetical protein
MIKDIIQATADAHKNLKDDCKKVINETMDELVERIGYILYQWLPFIYMALRKLAETLQEKLKQVIPDIKVWVDFEWWALEIHSEEREQMRLNEPEEEWRKRYEYDLVKYIWEFLRENVDLKGLRVGIFHSTYVNEEELHRIRELLDEWLHQEEILKADPDWRDAMEDAFESILHDYYLYRERIEGK